MKDDRQLELRRLSRFVVGVCGIGLALNCWADPSVPTLFSDHMVLQQGREIHVWGSADAGEKVAVSLAGHSASTTTDEHGKWSLRLAALPAGGPFTLVIHGKKDLVIKDVLIGEVWIASGQSNMTFSLNGSEGSAIELPKADYPQIRFFTVPRKIAVSAQANTLAAHWQICTPDSAKEFSAVGYYFAREIHRREGVPIGVVESAWPGTSIQEWIAPQVLQADGETRPLLDEWNRATPAENQFAETSLPFDLEFDDFELIPAAADSKGKALANFEDGSARTTLGGAFSYSWGDAGDSAFDLIAPGRGEKGYAARVAGRLDGTQDSILSANYKLDSSATDLTAYAGIRFWVRGNGSFRFRSRQPSITDYDNYGIPVQKATAEWQPVTILFKDLRQDGWGVVKPLTPDALTGVSIECLTTLGYAPMPVSALYEGMITPLLPYEFRGALWYQGESNAWKPHRYRKLLPELIQNWRDASQQKDLEFLIVQLPNHGAIPDEPGDSAWAELREAQLMTVKNIPHTGLAVTIDVGDPDDLHPHRKREVGERLALWALGTTYQEAIEYSGPLYEGMTIAGNEARLRFSHVGLGLEARGDAELQGFAVAGADTKFHWATARIEGDQVAVSSPEVANPVAVRYAWGDSPRCNLFNKNGLPASPFRSDDWPGTTGGR
jgi:sialate O-acetylesterase